MDKKRIITSLLAATCCSCLAIGLSSCLFGNNSESSSNNTSSGSSSIVDSSSEPIEQTEYTATFVDENGETVATITYKPGDTEIAIPDVPEKPGYTGEWGNYDLTDGNITIYPVYTAIEYTANFVDENGETVATVAYTVEDETLTEPTVPEKAGYTGEWETYTLTYGNAITVSPLYTSENVTEGLVYTLSTDGTYYTLSGYTGSSAKVVIPAVYRNLPVTAIGSSALKDNKTITALSIPESIAAIGNYAFYGCSALETIDYNAVSVSLAASNYIFYQAGQDGDGIAVTIGAAVKQIPDYLFNPYGVSATYAPKLTSVTFAEDSVCQSVGERAFAFCTGLTEIAFPDSVEELGTYLFYGCSSLQTVSVGAGMNVIRSRAFYSCPALTSLSFADTFGWYKGQSTTLATNGYAVNIDVSDNAENAAYFTENSAYVFLRTDNVVFYYADGALYGAACYSTDITSKQITNLKNAIAVSSVPAKEGYSGKWDTAISTSLLKTGGTVTINAVYTAIEYTANFVDENGETVATVAYTVEDETLTEPTVPEKAGYTGEWEAYTLSVGGVTIAPLYTSENATEGLVYTLSADGTYYTLSGYTGSSAEVIVPAVYRNLPVTAIGARAFQNNKIMTSLVVPESVTSVGTYAFNFCVALKTVTFSDGVASIDSYAFNYCSALTSIVLPDSIASIGSYAFQGCSALKSVTLPSSLPAIADKLFNKCSSLTSITLPETVTSIGSYAFAGCSVLEAINLPEAITSIGSYAFQNCSALTDVVVPSGIQTIEQRAFYQCSALTSVTLPASVTIVASYAFYNCSALTIVYYGGREEEWNNILISSENTPLTDAEIIYNALTEYTATFVDENGETVATVAYTLKNNQIVEPSVPEKTGYTGEWEAYTLSVGGITIVPLYTSEGSTEGLVYTLSEDGTYYTLSGYEGESANVIVPAVYRNLPVTGIGQAFRYNTTIESVVLPEGITSIDGLAFQLCSALQSVTLPDSVTNIGNYAFEYCAALTSITLPEGVKNVGDYAFSNCTALQSIILPDSVITLGTHVFQESSALKSVTLSASLTGLPNYTFKYCSSLQTISLPANMTSIGNYAFEYCSALTTISFSATTSAIGQYAFHGCTALTTIDLPDSITTIDTFAFYQCTALQSISLPASLTSISRRMFLNCSNLTSIVVPASVTSIASQAFQNCSALTSVYYTGNAESWSALSVSTGNTAYTDATFYFIATFVDENGETIETVTYTVTDETLAEPTVPQKTGYTGEWEAYTLTEGGITVSPVYTAIEYTANFVDENGETVATVSYTIEDESLAEPTVPEKTGYTGEWETYTLTYGNAITVSPLYTSEGATEGLVYTLSTDGTYYTLSGYTGSSAEVIIPAVYRNLPVTAIASKAFQSNQTVTNVTVPASVTSIGTYAFQNCAALTSVALSGNVTTIANYAFDKCSALSAISLPESVTSVGDYAFRDCIALEAIALPAKVTSIGKYAFDGCTALATIGLPAGLTTIGGYAFQDCTSLTNVTLPETLTSLGTGVFEGSGLTSVVIPASLGTVASQTFQSCASLQKVTVSEGITTLGNYAFRYCTSLTEISLPETLATISSGTFMGCTALTAFTAPASLTSIGSSAFSGCTALADLTLHDGVSIYKPSATTTSGNPFYQCTIVRAAVPADVLPYINKTSSAGYNTMLQTVVVTSGDSLAASALYGCTALTSITLPKTITSIGNHVFYNCSALTAVYYGGSEEDWNAVSVGTYNTGLTNATVYYGE